MRLLLTLLTVVGLLGCGGGECRFVYIAPNVQDQNVLQNNTNAIENYLDQNGLIANKKLPTFDEGLLFCVNNPVL